jgi:MGT family glycosyltransferase
MNPASIQLKNKKNGKRILFASMPAEGHFNPLTSVAVHLQQLGFEVRWYASETYAGKLEKLGIPHYPFQRAMEITGSNIDALLPEREKIKSQIKKLNFDLVNFFVLRAPEYFEDIRSIYQEFPFDLMIADSAFTGTIFVKDVLKVPVISLGIIPLVETSKDLAPAMLGITPSYSWLGRQKQALLRLLADKFLFGHAARVARKIMDEYGVSWEGSNIFDLVVKKSSLFLQSGTPSFEYRRSDLGHNIRFIGPLLPYSAPQSREQWFDARLNKYESIVLVTQGTVEKDIEKLLVPTLEACKDSDVLLVVTTGGSGTEELRKRYPQKNIIVEDFIPFDDIMPYADLYISNGGYGGVLMALSHGLPMLVAGKHEGKLEINARVGYFKLGINLKTEKPGVNDIRKGIKQILNDLTYRENALKLMTEFKCFTPNELVLDGIKELIGDAIQEDKAVPASLGENRLQMAG